MNDSKTSNDSGKSKHRKKVSFSIFETSTFDELAKLRKMREEELDYFVANKKKTNQYLNNISQRAKILSLNNNELLSFENNTNSNDTNSRNIHIKKNINIIPKPIKRDESIPDSSNNIFDKNFKNKIGNFNMNKKTLFSDYEEDIKSNELFPSLPKFNSIEKSDIQFQTKDKDNDNDNENIIKDNNILKSIEINNLNNNIEGSNDDGINKENDINNNIENENNINNQFPINNNIINHDYNNNFQNDNLEHNNINNNNNENDNFNYMNKIIEIEEYNKLNKINNLETNIILLYNILEKIYTTSESFKLYFIKEFFDNMEAFINIKYDLYIDYELSDKNYSKEVEEKSKLIHHKIYFNYFINKIRHNIEKNKLYNDHKIKAKKYQEYLYYKYKVHAFNNLYTFSKKQKEWIKSIQIGFNKRLVWGCVDSLKLYANYKKIKNYLKIRKKKKIFDVLKNNKQLSIQLLKKGKKLNLIYEYRRFFNICRKKILANKGKEINDKLVNEFRTQNLMKNIFGLIRLNCEKRKAKKNIYEKNIINKKINNEFINIKVTRKETVKFNSGSTLMRIQNKINII